MSVTMLHRKELLIGSIIYFFGALYGYYMNVLPYNEMVSNHANRPMQTQTDRHVHTPAGANINNETAAIETIEITLLEVSDGIPQKHKSKGGNQSLHEMRIYRQERSKHFHSWFEGNNNSTDKLLKNADKNGPILDFIIAGFPKTGTTTLMANLGTLAPMEVADICTPVHQTVYYSYVNWPKKHGEDKILRGSKCPAYLQVGASKDNWLVGYSDHLPKTKLIIGIRHPMKWFKSFWDMQLNNYGKETRSGDPYELTGGCDGSWGCRNSCPKRQLFCLHRARFHLALAQLGKTELSSEERKYLAPKDPDGGDQVGNDNVRNPVFLYEQSELNEDYVWEEMAAFLEVDNITHNQYVSSHGHGNKKTDFCDDEYDAFRAMAMPYAYEVSTWLQKYFIPVAKDESRPDVVIARPDRMMELVEDYKIDPCGKLHRLENGTYIIYNGDITSYYISPEEDRK